MEADDGGFFLRASVGACEGHGYQPPIHWAAGKRDPGMEGKCTRDRCPQLCPFHTRQLYKEGWRPCRRFFPGVGAIQVLTCCRAPRQSQSMRAFAGMTIVCFALNSQQVIVEGGSRLPMRLRHETRFAGTTVHHI